MSTAASSPGATRIDLEFDDNRLLPVLFGAHDQHLARIEQQLGVSVLSRGNKLAITGPADSADTARAALKQLYVRLKRGLAVDIGEVDAAVRIASSGPTGFEDGDMRGASGASPLQPHEVTIRTRKRIISARSPSQADYLQALGDHELVIAEGPAGTGKTYLAVATAISMLLDGRVDRIILSRPAVEAGERLGFLPGDLRQKVDPYLRPLYDAIYDMLPAEQVVRRLESGEIEVAPLAFMRGRTLANAFIILDEAQNSTPVQMKMFLTRLGEHSRMVVTGDISQVDLPAGVRSGMHDAMAILREMDGVIIVRFTDLDVVRHPLVTRVVRAYEAHEKGGSVSV